MTRLVITRGLPASGKTTYATSLQPYVVRVNRDDLRRMLHGRRLFTSWAERQVTEVQRASVSALLDARASVVVDDTNLRPGLVQEWARLAARHGVAVELHDLTGVSVEECIARDALRPEPERVGEAAIRRMDEKYLSGRRRPVRVPDGADPGADLPAALLVDIDGTVALIDHRSPYDWDRIDDDLPNPAVIEAVRAMHGAGNAIVFCTGRDEWTRPATGAWLDRHVGVAYEELLMRPDGDPRRDSEVKREMYLDDIRHRWRIVGVFDDRQHVVRMWRSLGLTVFQVAEGNY